jgi:hypothetical protein
MSTRANFTETIMKKPDDKDILQKNPQLDPERIAEYEAFQARMKDAGVEVRTKYLVEPALGSLMTLAQRR